jgi:hypothetical protein
MASKGLADGGHQLTDREASEPPCHSARCHRNPPSIAISTTEDDRRPVDIPVAGVDPWPGALDLSETERPCSHRRRPAVDRCPACGSRLCGDFGADDEG